MRFICIICCLVCATQSLIAQNQYPIPPKSKTHLFYIQHSDNHNTYVYDANMNGKNLVEDHPVEEYRIVYTEGGVKKPLTAIQKKFAYGLQTTYIKHNTYEMTLPSSNGFLFHLKVLKDGTPKVTVTVNQVELYLNHMFIQIKEGTSGLTTKVEYIEFVGVNTQTGKTVTQRKMM